MILLHNATVCNEGEAYAGYVAIEGERIKCVGRGVPAPELLAAASEAVDLQGDWLLPGVIDDQVHFRDPGLTHKGDIESESRAAVAGGVTSFMDMPNTVPQTVTVQALNDKYGHAAQVSRANYSFYMGATNTNLDEIVKVDFSRVCGVKAFLGSSTGNMLIDNSETLRALFSQVPALIAIHSEDEAIIRANRERYVAQYGTDLPLRYHPLIRSEEACYACSARAVELASSLGTRLHILHVSTARELSLLSAAPLAQKRITAEACVHYFMWDDTDYARLGNRIKCNPAIKTRADRDALRQGLRDGLIDVVATDHAPHLWREKQGGCLKAASGMPMVQYSLPAMLELAHQGVFTRAEVIGKMCHAPATLYRIVDRGYLRAGYFADIAVVHPCPEGYTLSDEDAISRCRWTPLAGARLHHRVSRTYVSGSLAYADGHVCDDTRGQRLTFAL